MGHQQSSWLLLKAYDTPLEVNWSRSGFIGALTNSMVPLREESYPYKLSALFSSMLLMETYIIAASQTEWEFRKQSGNNKRPCAEIWDILFTTHCTKTHNDIAVVKAHVLKFGTTES